MDGDELQHLDHRLGSPNPGDRVALITGAGRGLGAEIARTLAAAGYAVAVNDLPALLPG